MKAIKIVFLLVLVSTIQFAHAFTGGFGKDKKPTNSKNATILSVDKSVLSNKLFAFKPLNKHSFLTSSTTTTLNTPLYVKTSVTYKKNNVMYIKPVYTKITVQDKLTYNNLKKVLNIN